MPSPSQDSPLKVLFVTPECAPLVKTGGLGDVSAALPAALREAGVDARVLLPGYLPVLKAAAPAVELATLDVLGHSVRILDEKLPNGVPLLVADCPELYARGGGPYQADDGEDWEDNAVRFGVFSRLAATLGTTATPLGWIPDVLHCNDWPTALAPVYLHFDRARRAASLVTIHNLAFQGAYGFAQIAGLALPQQSLGMEGLEFYGRVSFLKGGMVYAHAVNTVSPTYAREIQTMHLGFGIDDWRKYDLRTIVTEILQYLQAEKLDIPIIPAGGIFTGSDAAFYLENGAAAVQVATRFTATRECGLPDKVKQEYFKASEEDIEVNMISPTGYPMRMLKGSPAIGNGIRPNCEAYGYLLDGSGNSGVQFRSKRVPGTEMSGYQADIGEGWYGTIYDESRRNKPLIKPSEAAVKQAVKVGQWNDYEIHADGPRIVLTINGVQMVDYTESDPTIPQFGRIGLQIHGGGKTEVRFKDLQLQVLP